MSGTAHVLRSIVYNTFFLFYHPATHVAMPSSTCIWYVAALRCDFIVLPQKTLTKWHCLLPSTFCIRSVVSVEMISRKKIYTNWQCETYFPIRRGTHSEPFGSYYVYDE